MNATQKIFRFGVFELNIDAEELRRSGSMVKLAPQPFQLLALLAKRAGQIVTREEIRAQLWGDDTYVDFEQGMNHCIKQIRTVLGDNADNPLYIETLPRRGYRFLAPVVSKTILAPAPRIIKSQSGVRSDVMQAALPPEATDIASTSAPVTPKGTVAGPPPEATAVSQDEKTPATSMSPTGSAQAAAHEESPALRPEATSAAAAAAALAPEIARLRKSPSRTRRVFIWVAVVLAALVAAILYWQLQRP